MLVRERQFEELIEVLLHISDAGAGPVGAPQHPLGELRERQRRRFPELVQDKKLRAREPKLTLRRTISQPQQTDETADGVENSLTIRQTNP